MPELLPRELVDSHTNFNIPADDCIFTKPGLVPQRNFEEVDVDNFAYTIDYYLKEQNKSIVYLTDYPETFEPRFVNFTHAVASKLYHVYNMPVGSVRYICGAWPIPENIEKYKIHCRENNWIELPVTCTNFFELCMAEHIRTYPVDLNEIDKVKKTKLFLYLNGGARWHRVYVLMYLYKNKLLDKGYTSMHTNYSGIYYIWKFLDKDSQWYKDFVRLLDHWLKKPTEMPLILSLKPGNFRGQHEISKEDVKLFSDSYFSVIGETSFFKKDYLHQPDTYNAHLDSIFLTEKTFRAIACKHPFIIMSRPHTLKHLRRMGYRTFSPIIDESYDEIENDYDRLKKICEVINNLCNQNKEFWRHFQSQTHEITLHNHNLLLSRQPYTLTNEINS